MLREVLDPSFDTTGQRLTWAETKAAPASSRTLRSIVDDRLRFIERSKGIGISMVFDIIGLLLCETRLFRIDYCDD